MKHEYTDKNYLNVKSNILIKASYQLTLMETQILLYGVSLITPLASEFPDEYTIPVKRFSEIFNKNIKSTYRELKKAVTGSLWSRSIEYENEKGEVESRRWIITVSYKDNNGYLRIRFHPDLKPFLYYLTKNFTVFYIDNVAHFKSVYSIRIYEFCIMEINKARKNKHFFLLNVENIKTRLGIQKKYTLFKDFKRRGLQKSKEEINSFSDLIIDFEEIHTGRKVESIKFHVERKPGKKPASYAKPKNQLNITEIQENPKLIDHVPDRNLSSKQDNIDHIKPHEAQEQDDKTKDSINSLSNLGVNHKQAAKYVKEYGTEAVNIAIEQTVKASEKAANDGKTINNIAAYVVKCLKNSSEVLTLNSDDINAHKQAEKEAKQKVLIDRELKWIKFDKWCSEYQEQIIPIIQKHMSGESVTDYQDYLFLKECAENVSNHLDIIDYPLLLTENE